MRTRTRRGKGTGTLIYLIFLFVYLLKISKVGGTGTKIGTGKPERLPGISASR